LLGGALADPIDGALIDGAILLFRCDSPAVVEDFVRVDPYVTGGLVKHWYIRQWHTVVGENSVNPSKLLPAPPAANHFHRPPF